LEVTDSYYKTALGVLLREHSNSYLVNKGESLFCVIH